MKPTTHHRPATHGLTDSERREYYLRQRREWMRAVRRCEPVECRPIRLGNAGITIEGHGIYHL